MIHICLYDAVRLGFSVGKAGVKSLDIYEKSFHFSCGFLSNVLLLYTTLSSVGIGLWQSGCDKPSALPSGRAFFTDVSDY